MQTHGPVSSLAANLGLVPHECWNGFFFQRDCGRLYKTLGRCEGRLKKHGVEGEAEV